MLKGSWEKLTLQFKQPSGTSRGVLTEKDSWLIKIWDDKNPDIYGIGEASIIKTLSPDWNLSYESKINTVCQNISEYDSIRKLETLNTYPSIQFAIETALLDLQNGGKSIIFKSGFTNQNEPILINGLIWMGTKNFMLSQIKEKIEAGFSCIKLKIGAIDFETELEILKYIRTTFSEKDIEIRVDANGAFTPNNALHQLEQLSKFSLHSIEQPIKQGQIEEMYQLCRKTPLPIALDEELIGVFDKDSKTNLLSHIQPQYIILKPSLIGGFKGTDEWVELAKQQKINWWITSALESNIGLNAIAQYTFTKNNPLPQGLGTGQLFTNNTNLHHCNKSLQIKNGMLYLAGF
ncbi:MAG TPA: o-succinylbenzoate synthase [Crocinitomix sp.]|nr:o-succinylbenzoate synthase [Crocinitomix sp.]